MMTVVLVAWGEGSSSLQVDSPLTVNTRSNIRPIFILLILATAGLAKPGFTEPVEHPAIAVVADKEWIFQWGHRDRGVDGLNRCLQAELEQANHKVVAQEDFLQAAFPSLPPEQAPTTPHYLKLALDHPSVQERLGELNIKYIVYITGVLDIEKDIRDMNTYCGLAGNVPICMGAIVYEQTHWLKATILDVDSKSLLGFSSANETGNSWGVHAGYFPVSNAANTEAGACTELAEKVSNQISRELAKASN